jgi:hypothetical protein
VETSTHTGSEELWQMYWRLILILILRQGRNHMRADELGIGIS